MSYELIDKLMQFNLKSIKNIYLWTSVHVKI